MWWILWQIQKACLKIDGKDINIRHHNYTFLREIPFVVKLAINRIYPCEKKIPCPECKKEEFAKLDKDNRATISSCLPQK